MKSRLSIAAGAALVVVSAVAAPAHAVDVPPDLELVKTSATKLGTHTWYRQTFHGLPVVGGYYGVHEFPGDDEPSIADGRKDVPADLTTEPTVESADAVDKAKDHLKAKRAKMSSDGPAKDQPFVPEFGDGKADLAVYDGKLVWDVVSTSSTGSAETFVDAHDTDVLGSRTLSSNIDGAGSVFLPNPVQGQKDQSLRDRGDRRQPYKFWYSWVTLPRLSGDGSHLTGAWANVIEGDDDGLAEADLSEPSSPTFDFWRDDDWFEQVSAYYGVDAAQEYIQGMGFTGGNSINNEPQDIRANTIEDDNSFYDSTDDTLTFGRGGVDDAEDLDIVWHEYGHAMLNDQIYDWPDSDDAAAIGEGFGDYWAFTMSRRTGASYESPCIGDWDSTAYTSTTPHCLRRVDSTRTYWSNWSEDEHVNGKIWSSLLWRIQKSLGRSYADPLILSAAFLFTPDILMPDAAQCIVDTAWWYEDHDYPGFNPWTVEAKVAGRHLDGGTCPFSWAP